MKGARMSGAAWPAEPEKGAEMILFLTNSGARVSKDASRARLFSLSLFRLSLLAAFVF
jgi:hypothetical protein